MYINKKKRRRKERRKECGGAKKELFVFIGFMKDTVEIQPIYCTCQ
jgi:predicted nucleic acid-binding Zn finger protein